MKIDELRTKYLMDRRPEPVKLSNLEGYRRMGHPDDKIKQFWMSQTKGNIPFEKWAATVRVWDPRNFKASWRAKQAEKQAFRNAVSATFNAFQKMSPEQQQRELVKNQDKHDAYRKNVMRTFAKTH